MSIRWGILGCGSIATSAIAPAIHWSSNGDLVAVASRSEANARRRADAVGAPKAYGSYEALLADPDIDAVYIGLPNGLHAEWALAAAEAGKHTLVDKSLTLDVASARTIADAFAKRELVLVEGFMVRHHPQWTRARELVESGAIGTPRHVRAVFRANLDDDADHRWSPTLGGGALFDVTCYAVNAARYFLSEEPVEARGFASMRAASVDASNDALLAFPSGAVAAVHGSLCAPFEQGVVVAGDEGRLVLARPFVPHWEPVDIVVERADSEQRHAVNGANHFLHMVEHVASVVATRPSERVLFPAEDGVANVRACCLIRDAR